jgi:hypothetical protein
MVLKGYLKHGSSKIKKQVNKVAKETTRIAPRKASARVLHTDKDNILVFATKELVL